MEPLFFHPKPGNQPGPDIHPRQLERAWIVLLAVFVFGLAINLRKVGDYDAFFNLIVGEQVFSTWSVPRQEFYIYSALGEPTIFVGWLYGTILYAVWKTFGYEGLSILNALLWAGVWALLAGACLTFWRKEGKGSLSLATACLLVALALCAQAMLERPMLRAEISMFFAWGVASLAWARYGVGKRLLLVVLPGLAWALAWLHTTTIFMLFFWCCLLADRSWDTFVTKNDLMTRQEAATFLGSLAMICLLPLANPNGLTQVLPLLVGLAQSHTQQAEGITIYEYLNIFQVPRLKPFALLLAVGSLFALLAQRKRRGFTLLSLIVGAGLSCLHVRALGIWALFLVIPLADSFRSFLGPRLAAQQKLWLVRHAPFLLTLAAIGWLISTVPNKLKGDWGIGLISPLNDLNAVNIIKQRYPEGGNVFTMLQHGALLRWQLGPSYQVAMDGHFVTSSRAGPRYELVQRATPDLEKILDEDKVVAVFHELLISTNGRQWILPLALLDSPNWRLAGIDPMGATFVRRREGEPASGVAEHRMYWRKVEIEAVIASEVVESPEEKQMARAILELARAELSRLEDASPTKER